MVREETVAEAVARSATRIAGGDLDDRTREYAKFLVISCIGAMAGGSRLPAGEIVTRHVAGQGGSPHATVAGTSLRTTMEYAGLANGTFAHATEYEDDSFPEAVSSFTVIPPLLAVAEAEGLDGDRLLRAVVVGHEIQSRLGRAYLPALSRGHQLLPIMGTIGTAGATAYLLGLDEEQMARALCVAASQAAGLRVQSGSMSHFLESGNAARAGILSACLARDGFDGDPRVFEGRIGGGPWGMLRILDTNEEPAAEIYEPWEPPYRVLDVGIKQYPMCTIITPLVEAVAALREQADFVPSDVASVEVIGHTKLRDHCDIAEPTNSTDAAFSFSHVIAQCLLQGEEITLDSFKEDQIADPQVAELRSRVELVIREDWPRDFFKAPVGTVITLADGRRLETSIEGVQGMPPQYLDRAGVERKFRRSSGSVYTADQRAEIVEGFWDLDAHDDVSGLVAGLGTA